MPFGKGATFCREWARISLWAFFSDVKVEGYENIINHDQPYIFACTHHNMLLDPAVICYATSKEYLHYWAKSSIFINNKYALQFLNSVGCVPVYRGSGDHKALYTATFKVFELNESIVVFPEGTSHTLPHLGPLKHGISFAALEYAQLLRDTAPKANNDGHYSIKPAAILPVGIVYTDKSKYRSVAIVRFGKPIQVDPYLHDFDKDPKATAKRVTKELEDALVALTINAPDQIVRTSAITARDILFPKEYGNMPDFIQVTQSLINILSNEDKRYLAENLYAYQYELNDLLLRDSDLIDYCNHCSNMNQKICKNLIYKSSSLFMKLPFFLPVFMGHFPLYLISQYYSKQEIYEESKAQGKILYATALVPFMLITLFLWVWYYLYRFRLIGFVFTGMTIIVFFWLHVTTIDSSYEAFKQWRGTFQLFDAFILQRGFGNRQKRILDIIKLRKAIQNELYNLFLDNSQGMDDNNDVDYQHVVNAIRDRHLKKQKK
ncbi:uncharacterized protein BX663DRAFT_496073 [Cokeromyces recurvatus]|uniref:uncharacterized protein n=1 Tax=Cokeromyces recurvatus TaxID=90255 RepID=UPI00221EB800|nr:uncharacterized protein BX663DRAFT_496073 [Cokeromyces recurvatus]KAI7906339.1 hypothetical protein BX663DRAFT_496073 [Cokeromyces recurvatus]